MGFEQEPGYVLAVAVAGKQHWLIWQTQEQSDDRLYPHLQGFLVFATQLALQACTKTKIRVTHWPPVGVT